MNWRPALSLALLWTAWLVCSSEKTGRLAERGSHGVRKVPQSHRAPSSLLRRSGASLKNLSPNPQHPVTKRDSSVPPKAPANLLKEESRSQPRSIGTRTRRVQRLTAAAKYSKSEMIKDEGISTTSQSRAVRFPSGSSSPNVLASFAGKNRVWVISAPHASEGYYRLMMSLLKNDVYCELAERHIQQIVLFHEEGEEGGKVRRITNEGKILEQPLDPALIPKLMSFLKLEKGKFGMVLLKKTLQVEERYPYPVRLEAMYEVIDQNPIRKIEKMRQKGFIQTCKAAGVEGQVVEDDNNGGSTQSTPGGGHVQVSAGGRKEEPRRSNQPTRTKTVRKPMTTTVATPLPTVRTTTLPTTTTATQATTRTVTTASRPTTTTTPLPTTQRTWTTKSHTTTEYHRLPAAPEATTPRVTASEDFYSPVWKANRRDRQRGHPEKHLAATRKPSKGGRYESFTEVPTAPSVHYTKASMSRFKDNRTDRKDYNHRDLNVTPGQHKPTKTKPPKKKTQEKILSNEYEDKYDPGKPASPHLEEEIAVGSTPPKKGKESKKHERMDKPEKKKKKDRPDKLQKSEKQSKKDKAEKKSKDKDRSKKNKKGSRTENEDFPKPNKKPFLQPPRKSVANLLDYFEGKRRLIVSNLFI
uniref:Coiled-coil domain-containing protein 80 n=1 Tax=Pavo cristatus TaxID=9049 RepID=A0A8C9FU78_PAVCR